jgi:hypothetical protein
MPKNKISKKDAKKMLTQLLDIMEANGLKDDFMEVVGQVSEQGLSGGGFNGFLEGLVGGAQGGGTAKSIGKVGNKLLNIGTAGLWGSGKSGGGLGEDASKALANTLWGSGKSGGKKGGKKNKYSELKNRGDIVKEVMKAQNMSLPQASKYVKEHNLYEPRNSKGSGKKGGVRVFQ